MKIIKLIFWVTALLLCLFHASMLVGHSSIAFLNGLSLSVIVYAYWTGILACGALLVWMMIRTSSRWGKAFTTVCVFATIILGAGMFWYLLDAPPLSDDYKEADIRPKANGSYQLLKIFNEADVSRLEKIKKGIDPAAGEEISFDKMNSAWEQITPYRQAIAALDKSKTICDLPPGSSYNRKMPFLQYSALCTIADIYGIYCNSALAQGRSVHAVKALGQLHRVIRKGMMSSTVLLHKMIFLNLADKTLETAYTMLLNKECGLQCLKLLSADFTPFDSKEYNLETVMIGNYLLLKNTIPDCPTRRHGVRGIASCVAYYFSFHPNRSLRHIKHYFDLLIKGQRQYPPDFTAAERFAREYAENPPLRNMSGWLLNTIAYPDFREYSNRTVRIKVKSDLLAVAIHNRLEKTADIADLFTGNACRFKEEKNLLRHPGEDGEFDTSDDIILGDEKL